MGAVEIRDTALPRRDTTGIAAMIAPPTADAAAAAGRARPTEDATLGRPPDMADADHAPDLLIAAAVTARLLLTAAIRPAGAIIARVALLEENIPDHPRYLVEAKVEIEETEAALDPPIAEAARVPQHQRDGLLPDHPDDALTAPLGTVKWTPEWRLREIPRVELSPTRLRTAMGTAASRWKAQIWTREQTGTLNWKIESPSPLRWNQRATTSPSKPPSVTRRNIPPIAISHYHMRIVAFCI